MSMWLRVVGLSSCVLIAACAPKVHVDNPDPFATHDPRAYKDGAKPTSTTEQPDTAPVGTKMQTGNIDRASLNDVLGRGLGAFLSGLEVQAYFDNHAFAGWEVLRFWPKHPSYAKVDIRPGDVVIAINDRKLERPSQVQRVWKALRTADTLVVRLHRLGNPVELRFEIRGGHKRALP